MNLQNVNSLIKQTGKEQIPFPYQLSKEMKKVTLQQGLSHKFFNKKATE